ncbi:transglutaminase domain-containing protein [Aequorivita flava]|uniref:Transglutaminase domain-containing protein n=1 Tax=Aequorivita flava TaxID=3114371 RepID=A0AB35YS93_9FLAO
MKLLFWFFIALNISAFGQDYQRVDAILTMYPDSFESPEKLSKFISRDFVSEKDKVRAIYTWIIHNIAYNPDEYKKFDYKFSNYRERNEKDEKLRNNIIQRTIKTGQAVCEGYAMLFERLCELQGIKNYLVRGDIKSNFSDIGRPFKRIHMWNVATIDGKPYLFDATWGAGKYNEKFIKDPTYFYYKTPPELFIKTHYPDMFEDAFLNDTITKEQFAAMPLIIKRELLPTDIESPKSGLLFEEEYYDEILFSIKNINPAKISYSYGDQVVPIKSVEREADRIKFNVPLIIGAKILLIYIDEKPALGYKIN